MPVNKVLYSDIQNLNTSGETAAALVNDLKRAVNQLTDKEVENVVPIALGGTNATTAAQARTNLGAAEDILATTTVKGLLSAADKIRINNAVQQSELSTTLDYKANLDGGNSFTGSQLFTIDSGEFFDIYSDDNNAFYGMAINETPNTVNAYNSTFVVFPAPNVDPLRGNGAGWEWSYNTDNFGGIGYSSYFENANGHMIVWDELNPGGTSSRDIEVDELSWTGETASFTGSVIANGRDVEQFIKGSWSPVSNIQLLRLTANDGGAITGDGLIFTGNNGALATSGAGSLDQVAAIKGYYFSIDTTLYDTGEVSRIGFGDGPDLTDLDYAVYVKIEKAADPANIIVSLELIDFTGGPPVTTGTTPTTVTNVADLAVGISTQGGNTSVYFYHPTLTSGPTITYNVAQQASIDRLFVRHEGVANAVLTITETPVVVYNGIAQGMNQSEYPANAANKAFQAALTADISTPVGMLRDKDIAVFGTGGLLDRILSSGAITVQSATNSIGAWMIGYGPGDVVLWRWFRVVANSISSGNTTVSTPITMAGTNYVTFGLNAANSNNTFYQSTYFNNTTTQFQFNILTPSTNARNAVTGVTIYGFQFAVTA